MVWLCCSGVEETIDTRPGVSNSVNDRRPGLRYTRPRLEVECDSTIERRDRTGDLRCSQAMALLCFRLHVVSSSQNRSGSKSVVRGRFGKCCVVCLRACEERGRAVIRCRPRPDCVELGGSTFLRSLRPSLEISAHCSKMAYATVTSLMQSSTTANAVLTATTCWPRQGPLRLRTRGRRKPRTITRHAVAPSPRQQRYQHRDDCHQRRSDDRDADSRH